MGIEFTTELLVIFGILGVALIVLGVTQFKIWKENNKKVEDKNYWFDVEDAYQKLIEEHQEDLFSRKEELKDVKEYIELKGWTRDES